MWRRRRSLKMSRRVRGFRRWLEVVVMREILMLLLMKIRGV